ncbi:hypothetical protein I4U23_012824 [Adineta vaga]|nr:hypothetical protein I4U23_012824 [Adineta vaga]
MNILHFVCMLICFTNNISTESCLLSNTSYALCSISGTTPMIKSKSFTKTDFDNECHVHFVETILKTNCNKPVLDTRKPPTSIEKYAYGFLAVFIVSALSLAGLLAFPLLYKVSFQYVLTLFTALAVGTLFGDTMFHLIPFALGSHGDHDGQSHATFSVPDYAWKMLISVLILYSFYLLEVLLHSFAHYKHKNSNSVHFHAHGHSHSMPHHNHSHPEGEICEHTPLDIDADLEHGHRLHNHMHHNLHQHVSNEISTASSLSAANQTFHNNNNNNKHSSHKNLTCVPCAYSNETRSQPATSILKHDSKDNISVNDDQTPVSVVIADPHEQSEPKKINPVVQQLKKDSTYAPGISLGLFIHMFFFFFEFYSLLAHLF